MSFSLVNAYASCFGALNSVHPFGGESGLQPEFRTRSVWAYVIHGLQRYLLGLMGLDGLLWASESVSMLI